MTIIRPATTQDAVLIQELAEATWWPTYEPIVGKVQVRYMLDAFYATEVITNQIDSGSQTYILLYDGETPKGFAAYSPRPEDPAIYKLHKLYCLPSEQGKGLGRQLVYAVEKAVLASGHHILELNVNRHNNAKSFYEKLGFSVIYDEDIKIGNGYEMNDHVMRKLLSHQALTEDLPNKSIDFIAQVKYRTAEEGGRTTPAFTGYRPQVKFPFSEMQTSGQQTFIDKDAVYPGDSVRTEFRLLTTAFYLHCLNEGLDFEIREGAKIVATGKILEIKNKQLIK